MPGILQGFTLESTSPSSLLLRSGMIRHFAVFRSDLRSRSGSAANAVFLCMPKNPSMTLIIPLDDSNAMQRKTPLKESQKLKADLEEC
ncbi:hypothetical protein Nepgr_011023 [Nepenthes gracilis]|uniref:Uncharacterized protein n=1 Tax=Nepenthes gracilis TaxID=150966 RepID=A0AAD3SDF5_NEPGR|nr:hypothetical protein Nepgr_011023 [Nepenthes gracilis]